MKFWMFFSAALLSTVCSAQPTQRAAPPDLPGNEAGELLINEEPSVVQARHALEAARHRAKALYAGSHEWTAKAAAQQRRDRSAGGGDSKEWMIGLERAIRIGGKDALDRELGDTHVRLAEARYGEARHEAAKTLLGMWLDWSATQRIRGLWQEQLRFSEDNVAAASKRRSAGDASILEHNAARADLAEMKRQLSSAMNEEAKARALLSTRFPTLRLETTLPTDPEPLGGDPAQWRERIIEESDVLNSAKEELRLAELQAARARADRMPDPTVGIYTNSDRSGAERVIGLSFSMPIGGTARRAQAQESLQQAEAARAAVERTRRALEAEIAQAMANVTGSLERWRLSQQSLEIARDNARLAQRAYSLGEADLQTLLLSRRQAIEAALGSEQSRTDAQMARYELFVDAHLIWGLAAD